jgi:hypothetical protein
MRTIWRISSCASSTSATSFRKIGVARSHDDVADLFDVVELALRSHQHFEFAFVHRAHGAVLILLAQDVGDLVDRKVVRAQFFDRGFDMDLTPQPAANVDGGYAGKAFETWLNVFLEQRSQFARVLVARNRQEHDRKLRGIEFENRRWFGVIGQRAAHPVDARANLVGRLIQIDAPVEADANVAGAFGRGRRDSIDAGRGTKRGFERAGDQILDLFRRHAGIGRSHGERRVLYLRHQIDRQSHK